MKKFFGKKAAQGKANDTRKPKPFSEKIAGVNDAVKKAAHDTNTAIHNAANAAAKGTVSIVSGAIVGTAADIVVNNGIIKGVALADSVYYKATGTGTVKVKKMIGYKTLTDAQYLEKLAKGKNFKDVIPQHWCNQHAAEINEAANIAGKVSGVVAGVTTVKSMYKGLTVIDKLYNESEVTCDDFEENESTDSKASEEADETVGK